MKSPRRAPDPATTVVDAAAGLVERTTATSGVPRTVDDPQTLRRVQQILDGAQRRTRGRDAA
jgi:hypothetical protein